MGICSTLCEAQKIDTVHAFGGYDYTYKGKALSMKKLVSVMNSNSVAQPTIKAARRNNTLAILLGGIGSSFILYHIALKASGNTSKSLYPIMGINILTLSIPFTAITKWQTKKAVNQFNSDLNL